MSEYVELILKWKANADTDKVRDWLRKRGISFMEMQSGLLVSGSKRILDQNLKISLDNISPPACIPVPPELESDVMSIMLPSPRQLHVRA